MPHPAFAVKSKTNLRMYWTMNLATIALASISSTVAFSGLSRISRDRVTALSHQRREVDVLTRRETLESWVVGAVVISTGFLTSPEMALAFPNKISNQYDDRPKQRGSKVCVFCTVEVALVDFFGRN
jgi:ABC-type enterochelin transport system permease subunit